MNRFEKEAWELVRARGKARFIVSGLLGRGFKFAGPFTATFFFIDLWIRGITHPWAEAGQLAMTLVWLTLAVGWGEGEYLWAQQERDYQWTAAREAQNS
jgi:hypothetical protein